MPITRPSLNPREPIVQLERSEELPLGAPSRTFLTFMRGIGQDIDNAPQSVEPVDLPEQNATIPTTAVPTDGDLSEGAYRLSWYLEVTTVATTSSSAQVTIAWTSDGISKAKAGATNNGNLTTTYEANSVPLMRVDAATPITYAVNYASNGAGEMKYRLVIILERMAAL